ncbi:hypothetical protein ACHQM5_018148 [Ranunculus cassubicifolius]
MAPPTEITTRSKFPVIPIQNIATFVPIKLGKDNFNTWQSLFIPVLRSFNLISLVDGTSECPPSFITDSDGKQIINPDYLEWQQLDQLIQIWINATVSEAYLPYIVGISSAQELWKTLETRFATLTRSHVLQLRSRLQAIRKGSSSITNYLQQIKEISDSLAASGNRINDYDLVFHILNGLPSEYDAFATSIRVREPIVSSDQLHSLLLTEELSIESRNARLLASEPNAFTAYRQMNNMRGRGPSHYRGRGSSRGRNGGRQNQNYNNGGRSTSHQQSFNENFDPNIYNKCFPQASKPVCQICQKPNHSALECYHRMNFAYSAHAPTQKLQAMVAHKDYSNYASSSTAPSPWVLDSGATNHVSADTSTFSQYSDYNGPEKLSVGNGDALPIEHTGSWHEQGPPDRFT